MPSAIALLAATFAGSAGCQVDEITFGVGNARTEDAFGNPVVRPYAEEDSLQVLRYKIPKPDPEQDKAQQDSPIDSPAENPPD
jgi:hypothetical protein